MDKRFKLLFIILCFAISAFAQQFSVSGRVTDADGHPLDFANVFIVAPGDKIEASAVCDVDGKFKMTVSAGKCMLGCTFIGYEMYQNVIDLNSDIDVGDIKMQQSATELQTVVVQGRLMSVRMQKDGYSVDVSKTSNPQPIGFSGILLAKRQNSFYCTYFLHNRNVADTKSPYPIKRLEVIRWFNQKSMVFNQSLS